jgi:hypothetical protein
MGRGPLSVWPTGVAPGAACAGLPVGQAVATAAGLENAALHRHDTEMVRVCGKLPQSLCAPGTVTSASTLSSFYMYF